MIVLLCRTLYIAVLSASSQIVQHHDKMRETASCRGHLAQDRKVKRVCACIRVAAHCPRPRPLATGLLDQGIETKAFDF